MSTENRTLQPYLFFNGRCEEAIEFYRKALNAELQILMRFKDSPDPTPPGMVPPGWENKVMHASLRIGDTRLMVSDGCADSPGFQGFSLSLTVSNDADADSAFNGLADGGQVRMPLSKTFWAPRFGMLEDRFGVGWMITVMPPGQA